MKSFNEVYEKVYKEVNSEGKYEELENLRNNRDKKVARTVKIYTILAIIVFGPPLLFVLIVGDWGKHIPLIIITILVIFRIKAEKNTPVKGEYTAKFQESVIAPFINNLGESLEYYPNGDLPQELCEKNNFNRYSKCQSEDLILGKIDNKQGLILAQVTYEVKGSEGELSKITKLYGNIKCTKNIGTSIRIERRDEGIITASEVSGTRVEMDSSEFEKHFDVYAENKIVAMQILTSEVMQMLLDFSGNNKTTYNLIIRDDYIDIIFHTGEVFEPENFKEVLDYDMLKGYYNIIDFVLKLGREINKAIEKAEV